MASQGGRLMKKLFVGNLNWTVGHRELLDYFSQFGHLSYARVKFDKSTGMSRGYGFLEFSSESGYEAATSKKDHVLEGSPLSLQPATQSHMNN